jgi:hypothetical protein
VYARELLFGKAILVDPLRVLAYSVDVCLYGKSFSYVFNSSRIFVVFSVFRDACFKVLFRMLIFIHRRNMSRSLVAKPDAIPIFPHDHNGAFPRTISHPQIQGVDGLLQDAPHTPQMCAKL